METLKCSRRVAPATLVIKTPFSGKYEYTNSLPAKDTANPALAHSLSLILQVPILRRPIASANGDARADNITCADACAVVRAVARADAGADARPNEIADDP